MILSPTNTEDFQGPPLEFVPSSNGSGGSVSDTEDSVADTNSVPNEDSSSPGPIEASNGSFSPTPDPILIYEFEVPQETVGKLIGKRGCFIHHVKNTSGANVQVRLNYAQENAKLCYVEGTRTEVDHALMLIRNRFPPQYYPNFTLAPVNQAVISQFPGLGGMPVPLPLLPMPNAPLIPPAAKLGLVESVNNDVTISAYRSSIQLSLQQPTHPTFPALAKLHKALKEFYKDNIDAPGLVTPFSPGVICVAPTNSEGWVRAEVITILSEDSCLIRHVDIGTVEEIAISELRQIRCDFLAPPFQSVDCKLYALQTTKRRASISLDSYLRPFFTQMLQAQVVAYDFLGTPLVQLYRLDENQVPILVNQELVDLGLARYDNGPEIEEGEQSYTDAYVAYHTQELQARKAKHKSRIRTFSTPVDPTTAADDIEFKLTVAISTSTSSTSDTEPSSVPSPSPSQ